MKKFCWYFVLFFVVCVILSASFSPTVLLYCAVISASSAAATAFIFKFSFSFKFSAKKLFLFFPLLFVSVYVSAFSTFILFIKNRGRIEAELEDVPLATPNPLYRLLICQGVTLTPGTVSVHGGESAVSVLKFAGDSLASVRKFTELFGEK